MTDEAMDRLARGWFAEARARTRDDEAAARRSRPVGRAEGDVEGDFLDWLLGGDAADDGCCDGGD